MGAEPRRGPDYLLGFSFSFRYTNAIEKKYYKAIDTSSRHDHYPQLIDMDSATTKKEIN